MSDVMKRHDTKTMNVQRRIDANRFKHLLHNNSQNDIRARRDAPQDPIPVSITEKAILMTYASLHWMTVIRNEKNKANPG